MTNRFKDVFEFLKDDKPDKQTANKIHAAMGKASAINDGMKVFSEEIRDKKEAINALLKMSEALGLDDGNGTPLIAAKISIESKMLIEDHLVPALSNASKTVGMTALVIMLQGAFKQALDSAKSRDGKDGEVSDQSKTHLQEMLDHLEEVLEFILALASAEMKMKADD